MGTEPGASRAQQGNDGSVDMSFVSQHRPCVNLMDVESSLLAYLLIHVVYIDIVECFHLLDLKHTLPCHALSPIRLLT